MWMFCGIRQIRQENLPIDLEDQTLIIDQISDDFTTAMWHNLTDSIIFSIAVCQ